VVLDRRKMHIKLSVYINPANSLHATYMYVFEDYRMQSLEE